MTDLLGSLAATRILREEPEDLHDPRAYLAQALSRRSRSELSVIATTKRFRERLIGDEAFRTALRAEGSSLARDYEQYRPLWDRELGRSVWNSAALAAWPDVQLWKAWHDDLARYRDLMLSYPSRCGTNSAFTAWRQRQIARTASELGSMHAAITHPVVAYELASGCSVGCWFCGISAQSFTGTASYADHASLWRQVLATMVERLGPAARTGFCYWGTDPADTPDYDLFLEDHGHITGWVPQTTTAAPLRDVRLTRRILALSKHEEPVLNRFSVLTIRQMNQIFEAFTPMELLLVELVPQMRGSLMPKARAGRALARGSSRPGPDLGLSDVATTIACVSGFLINLPEKRIRLTAPCRSDAECPDGYIVLADEHFARGEEFAGVLDCMIAEHVSVGLPGGTPIRFRRDLDITVEAGVLRLENDVSVHHVEGFPFMDRFAELMAMPHSAEDVTEALVSSGANFFDIHRLLVELYDGGLIEPQFSHRKAASVKRDA